MSHSSNDHALRYTPPPDHFDEVVDASGATRPAWQAVARALGSFEPAILMERQRQADRLLDAQGTGHLVHEISLATDRHGVSTAARSVSHPWRLDPMPFVLEAAEFEWLVTAVTQRMRALEALLADCHGPRRLVADGVVPASLLHSSAAFRPGGVAGTTASGPRLVHYALDLVRNAGGAWQVVEDHTDAPAGLGYALLNRTVLARVVPDGLRTLGVAAVNDHADTLRRALVAAAPSDRQSPRSVVLTAGPADPTYIEQSYLATRLGLHLVEAADVVMRTGRLWLRVLDGLEPIDVVYRRVADAHLDPLEPNHLGGGAGVPGMVWGAQSGGVVLANAYGAGLAEDATIAPYIADAARHLLGEFLTLTPLPDGSPLGCSPVFVGGDRPFEPRPVVLRMQVTRVGDEVVVLPGGAGRVLAPGDAPSRPTAHLAKDVWVVGAGARSRPIRVQPPPQVDFGASVPKRVADALFWLGRAAERAEVTTRASRVVTANLLQDPSLASFEQGAWSVGAAALLCAAQAAPSTPPRLGDKAAEELNRQLAATHAATAVQLASLVQEATSVREYLSTTTGRVLGRLAAMHPVFLEGMHRADDLDTVLVDLAALSGLMAESTVRGPSWRFLDMGRRLERALAVLGAVEATLGLAVPPLVVQPLAEALLAANESLVAYRRRYRSDVDFQALLDLLIRDDANPRSLAYQLDRLREHTAGLAWHEGAVLVEQASVAALTPVDDDVVSGRVMSLDAFVLGVRGPLLELAAAIVQRWFADPVNPTLMRGY